MTLRNLIALAVFSISPIALITQSNEAAAPPAAKQAAPSLNTREGITEHEHRKYAGLVKNLALTPDQQTQVKAVLDNRLAEELAVFDSAPEVKTERMKVIDAESRARIRAILNDDQRAKYNKALQDEADRIAARQQKIAAAGGDAHPDPSQPPTATTPQH